MEQTATWVNSSQQARYDSLLYIRMDTKVGRIMRHVDSLDMQAVIFDTTQPIDSATGLSPVKAVIRQHRKTRTTDSIQARQKTTQSAEVSKDIRATEQSNTVSTLQVDKRQNLAAEGYLVCGLLSLLLSGVTMVIIYMKQKRYEYRSNH